MDNTASASLNRKIIRLALPCLAENFFSTMVGFVDTAMVGSLGAHATASIGAVASFTWLIGGLVQSIGIGGTAIVARQIGAGEKEKAENVTGQMFWLAFFLSAFMTLFVLLFGQTVPRLLRADPVLYEDSTNYLKILCLGYIPNYIGMSFGSLLRGAGDTKTPMKAGILANITNVFLNFLLIYPSRTITIFGLQLPMWGAGLGISGAAIASAVANASAGIFIVARMRAGKSLLKPKFTSLKKLEREICIKILRIGAPAALERIAINVGQMVFAAMISSMGVVEIASHTLAIQVEALGYMPAFGFATAATAMVGQNLGAKNEREAMRAGHRAALLSASLLTVIGLFMFVFSHELIAIFTPDPMVRSVGAMLICICSFEQPFNALSSVYTGALRGAGDTVAPFLFGFVSMWAVRIFPAYLFGIVMGKGVQAVWWCMVADLGVRSLLGFLRFRSGKWAKIKV